MKKIIFVIIAILLLTGCSNKKCVKSHQEDSICPRPIIIGKMTYITYYPCEIEICDEYEENK